MLFLDDVYLLQFLRARKYSMDDVYQTFENIHLAKRRYPQFFDFTEEEFTKALKLLDSGFLLPLPTRDAGGRKIILLRTKKIDTELFTVYDTCRVLLYAVSVLLEEEETQIAGIILIFDHSDITLKHVMSPMDIRDFMHFVKHCSAIRQKGNYVLNLPSFASIMIDLFKAFLSEKLKTRLFVLKSYDELKAHFDESLLPKYLGGTKSEAEILAEFKQLCDDKKELTRQIVDTIVLWEKVPAERIQADESEPVGSFRKLEID